MTDLLTYGIIILAIVFFIKQITKKDKCENCSALHKKTLKKED